jgi:hypothetical protein
MQQHLGDRTDLSRLQPEVATLIGQKIEQDWKLWARNSGQLFPRETQDGMGRTVTMYEGDIKTAFAPFNQPTIRVKLAETTNFQGKTYIRGQEPPAVRRAMLLASHGFSE